MNERMIIKMFKTPSRVAALFVLAAFFCNSLFADNLLQESIVRQHDISIVKNKTLNCKPINYANKPPDAPMSKFMADDKLSDNALKSKRVPKNSQTIDKHIFASPKSIKQAKRLFI